MALKPRIYLFHGNDSWSSSQALQRWINIFKDKYGDSTRFSVSADETPPDEVAAQLASTIMGDALFPEPKLVVVRRIGSIEKPPSFSISKSVVTALENYRKDIDEHITLVFWEERHLPPKHPLLVLLESWEKEGMAKIQEFDVPSARTLLAWAERWSNERGMSLSPDARTWLSEIITGTEVAMRANARLKAGDALTSDDRVGWVHNMVSTAALRCSDSTVSREDLIEGYYPLSEAAVPFTLINAAQLEDWHRVNQEVEHYTRLQDADSGYYGFIAAMRWTVRQKIGRGDRLLGDALLKWLVEWEVIAKNFPVPMPWLFQLYFLRWSQFRTRGFQPLIDEDRLLLMLCARS